MVNSLNIISSKLNGLASFSNTLKAIFLACCMIVSGPNEAAKSTTPAAAQSTTPAAAQSITPGITERARRAAKRAAERARRATLKNEKPNQPPKLPRPTTAT